MVEKRSESGSRCQRDNPGEKMSKKQPQLV